MIEPVQVPLPGGAVRWIIPARCRCEIERWEQEQQRLRGGVESGVNGAVSSGDQPLFPAASLGPRYAESMLHNFERRRGTEAAVRVAEEFVESWHQRPAGLLFVSGNGRGKTRLAAAVINELYVRYNVRGRACVVAEWLEDVRAWYHRSEGPDPAVALRDAPCLLLDDIGAEKVTEWVQEKLFLLVDYRYRYNLPTLFTTNLMLPALADLVGTRITSRIVGMARLVPMDTDDYRFTENQRLG